jgi:nucleoside-diphosphate-sugar epimerase
MAKTLLTGATGFIGSELGRALLERGDDLRVAVRGDGKRAIELDAEQVRCDILDRRSVRRAMKGVDRVFHAAGVTSVPGGQVSRTEAVHVQDGERACARDHHPTRAR